MIKLESSIDGEKGLTPVVHHEGGSASAALFDHA